MERLVRVRVRVRVRVGVGVGVGVTMAAVVGLGAYFVMVGLDKADKVASSIGVLVGVVGLAVAVFGTGGQSAVGRRVSQQAMASGRGRVLQVGGSAQSSERGSAAAGEVVVQRATVSEDAAVTQTGGDQGGIPPALP